jgi:hypothetical protein
LAGGKAPYQATHRNANPLPKTTQEKGIDMNDLKHKATQTASHTTGDWRLNGSHGDYEYAAIESGDKLIAMVLTENECQATPEEIANAKLLVAAPELLDALQAASQWIDAQLFEQRTEIQQKINDAIAKATGRAA